MLAAPISALSQHCTRCTADNGAVYVAAMLLLAVALAWPVPRLLPRLTALRATPGPALLLWQAVSLAAIAAGLLAAPLAVLVYARTQSGQHDPSPVRHLPLLVMGLLVAGILLVRLLIRAHRVGRALRRGRRIHTELIDLIGLNDVDPARLASAGGAHVRVLAHATPTAYCIPGAARRVVLTQGTLDALDDQQLAAVLAHEHSHLRQRHDLVLEFFTVLHTAVPQHVRSDAGMSEVKLLIELLADRWAVLASGKRPLATALLMLAQGQHPASALGATDEAVVRIEQLAYGRPRRTVAIACLAASLLVLALPVLLAAATLISG